MALRSGGGGNFRGLRVGVNNWSKLVEIGGFRSITIKERRRNSDRLARRNSIDNSVVSQNFQGEIEKKGRERRGRDQNEREETVNRRSGRGERQGQQGAEKGELGEERE